MAELTSENMELELQALALEEEELRKRMLFQQQRNKLLLMRAHAEELRQELQQEESNEKNLRDHKSRFNNSHSKQDLCREVNTSRYGLNCGKRLSLLHRLRNNK